MADANAIVLRDLEPPDTDLAWRKASESVRLKYYTHAADIALSLKQKEIRRGVGVDGKRLAPVKPSSRPDGATGPPLTPHTAESRTRKWLRVSIGLKSGTITLWWSHGWGQILGWHGAGLVRGAPVRDVIGLTSADLKKLHDEMRLYWLRLKRGKPSGSPRAGRQPSQPTLPPLERKIAAKHPEIAPYLVPSPEPPRPVASPDAVRPPGALGLTFGRSSPAKADREPTVVVQVQALDAAWREDGKYYIPPGGGADKQKYANAVAFVRKAQAEGIKVEMPRVTVDKEGVVSFGDGRHRFAAMRDLGAHAVPVSVDKHDAARARKLYGLKTQVVAPLPASPATRELVALAERARQAGKALAVPKPAAVVTPAPKPKPRLSRFGRLGAFVRDIFGRLWGR
jgi:hypothetical protein